MKPDLTTLEGNLAACNHADDLYVRMKESGMGKIDAQEDLILATTEAIWKVLEERKWSKADLARAMHTSRANITQLLDGSRNMTLRSLSDIAFVLGIEVHVQLIHRNHAPLEPPTQTDLHCQEHKRERIEKMLERVYGFLRRKV